MEVFNKLVRDNIPEIIRLDNKIPKIRILDEEDYKIELLKKLIEEAIEAKEALKSKSELTKELGDLLEVIDYTIKAFDLDKDEIVKLKERRRQERGGFDQKIYLESFE